MIDPFDYQEPACPLCDGQAFYHPKKDAPQGRIPVDRIIDKVDGLFDKKLYQEAGRLLVYWKNEAVALGDKSGELTMESELVGYYRKQNDREKGLASCVRALALTKELDQEDMASGATVLINCATAYKAFGMAREALPLYRQAETVYKKVLSANDPRFGGLYNNMALALVDTGDVQGAEAAYFAALSVMEQAPNSEAECAMTHINLAHMYDKWGQEDKIAPCLKTAYALLCKDTLPRDGYYAFVLEKCAPSFGYFGDVAAYQKLKKTAEDIYARA